MKDAYIWERNRRFYDHEVAPMIKERFAAYEDRIAVGIAGEGSDCFGYDDLISRDHDFGTGVCLWVSDDDFHTFGRQLSIAYNELVDRHAGSDYSDRLRERRGVMTIHDFYSNILGADCDTDGCVMSEVTWRALDHSCLATAVNGIVFRDDVGSFTAFRELLLAYYPDRVWRIRIANELHHFSASLQVNYARCMARKDLVAAGICKANGIEAAMELFFLLKRVYPPYYKWTYRALCEIDEGSFAPMILALSEAPCDSATWEGYSYSPDRLNLSDGVIRIGEEIAAQVLEMLKASRLVTGDDPYLERYVNEVLNG